MKVTLPDENFTHIWLQGSCYYTGTVTPCPNCGEPVEDANAMSIPRDANSEWSWKRAISDGKIAYLSPGPLQPGYWDNGEVADVCENCIAEEKRPLSDIEAENVVY